MSTSMYASRKRKKPQKSVKPAAAEGAKSNPSKRHRERLNGELERLSNQLPFPQDVTSKLDKLTILRLCVSYLRAKSFFNVTLKSTDLQLPESKGLKKHGPELPEGELLLQVLNGFILVVTTGGTMFYASNNIQEYLGFQQSDVIHQSVYELIHTEDRAEFQRQLHWALNPNLSPDTGQLVTATEDSTSPQTYYNPELLPPENSTFLERNFVCRFRCLLDNSSGFLALNFQGRLKFLRGQNERTKDGKPIPPQLALFALASPLQPPSILEIRTKNLIFRTKHKLDFTPTACDAKGRIVLGYTEAELCYRGSGYQFIHAADMLYCAENHMRMIKTGESGMTVFRLLTKQSGWVWVQANARLIYKNGQPECVIVSQKVLTDKEGEENLKKRNLELPFNFTTGEAVLYDTTPKALGDCIRGDTLTTGINNNQAGAVDPNSLLGSLLKQDESIYVCDSPQKKQPPLHLPVDTPALPEEECGGIFSSSWQEGILSLSQNALFKQEPLGSLAVEDRDGDLWTFMSNLGIIREDFELFQQDEMFLNVDLDGRDSLPDLTDEILSYVQASLSKRSDCVFSFSAKLGDQDPSYTTLEQQGNMQSPPVELQQPALQQHSYIAPQWQQPQLPVVHSQSVHQYQYQPLSHYPQQCLNAQPHPLNLLQSTQYQGHHLSQPPTQQQQQLFPLNGHGLTNQLWQQQHDHLHSLPMPPQQQQLCHRLKHMQVNGSGPSHSQQAITNGQQIPPLFQVDKPGLQTCSHPQYGHLHRGEPTLSLPYRNQLNTVSVTHCAPAQELSYVPTGLQSNGVGGDLIDQDLGEVLGSLDSDPQGEQNGRGAPQWSVETMSMYHQQHLTDPQSTSMGSAQLNNPVVLGRVNSTEQPFMPQFQNGSHGSL